MLYSPWQIAILGMLIWFVILVVSPVSVVFPISLGTSSYIFFSYLFFYFGCLLARPRSTLPVIPFQSISLKVFWLLSTAGFLGMALRVYDKFFLRQSFASDSVLDSRQELVHNEAGALSVVAAVLYPLCYVPLIFLYARSINSKLGALQRYSAFVLFILPATEALLLFSRAQLLIAFSMGYMFISLIFYEGRIFERRLMIRGFFGVGGLIIVFSMVFVARLSEVQVAVIDSVYTSVYGFTVVPSEWVARLWHLKSGMFSTWMLKIAPIAQYYTHGIFEFGLLWDRPDSQTFSYGGLHFSPYLKLFGMMGLPFAVPEMESIFVRTGTFTSFFGPLWVDFGWFGPLVMMAFGFSVQSLSRLLRKGYTSAIPLYLYLCITVFFFPVVNFIVSAQGGYLVTTFLVVMFLFRPKKRTV